MKHLSQTKLCDMLRKGHDELYARHVTSVTENRVSVLLQQAQENIHSDKTSTKLTKQERNWQSENETGQGE